jgi:hypothetical protein
MAIPLVLNNRRAAAAIAANIAKLPELLLMPPDKKDPGAEREPPGP